MLISVQVIKVYEIETEGGDTTDHLAVDAHCRLVEMMQSTEIEEKGRLADIFVEDAKCIGPSDPE